MFLSALSFLRVRPDRHRTRADSVALWAACCLLLTLVSPLAAISLEPDDPTLEDVHAASWFSADYTNLGSDSDSDLQGEDEFLEWLNWHARKESFYWQSKWGRKGSVSSLNVPEENSPVFGANEPKSNEIPPLVSPPRPKSWKLRRFQQRHSRRNSDHAHLLTSATPTLWFNQSLDHFHPTDTRQWRQRYFINDTFYKTGGPAFLMIGGEGEANPIWMTQGAWLDYAREHGAICFMLEHRFYGKSHPTEDMSVKNLSYLTSEQALGDLANFVAAMNIQHNLTDIKWIAFGGSYPGSLAAWFRLKYPHIVHGSVSTSGPLLAKIDFFEYLQVVSRALDLTKTGCRPALQDALNKVSMLTAHRIGWRTLTKLFNLCTPFDGTKPLDESNFFENLIGTFEDVTQYNRDNRAFEGVPFTNVTIDTLCDIMTDDSVAYPPVFTNDEELEVVRERDGLTDLAYFNMYRDELRQGTSVLQKLARTVKILHEGDECVDFKYETMIKEMKEESFSSSAGVGGRQWTYQTCTEFGWYQSSDQPGHPYLDHFPVGFFEQQCKDIFGPKFNLDLLQRGIDRSNWMYGAKDIKVSNVVFVHGSFDPWHAMGLTETKSSSTPAIFIQGTAHCANMYPKSEDDLEQLKQARTEISAFIKEWLSA